MSRDKTVLSHEYEEEMSSHLTAQDPIMLLINRYTQSQARYRGMIIGISIMAT